MPLQIHKIGCMYKTLFCHICDPVWDYVHKIHLFTLFQLSHLLCKLYYYLDCVGFPIANYTISQSFIDTLYLDKNYQYSKCKKVVKFCKHCFDFLKSSNH